MIHRFSKTEIVFLVASTAIPLVAYSQIYLTEDQAVKALFPKGPMVRKTIILTPEEVRKIEEKSDEKIKASSVIAWVSPKKEILFVDQVLGKHEFISYVVGISEKKVIGIEILEYRENFGKGVIKPEWRKQFIGKDSTSTLRLNQDIVNISGATLSSAHVTDGVRRILQTYEVIKNRL